MSYTKTYPQTGSTLTINFPDGLFEVVENPRDYYREVDTEEYWGPEGEAKLRCQYPDLLLIPTNGSRISNVMVYQKEKYKEYEIDENGESLYGEDDQTPDYPTSYSMWNNHNLWNSNIEQVKKECETISFIPIVFGLESNELDFLEGKKRYEDGYSGRYYRKAWDIELTIDGETEFFKSTASRFFCKGDTDSQVAYFTHRNKQKNKQMWGYVTVSEEQMIIDDDGNRTPKNVVIDLYAVSLLQRQTRSAHNKEAIEYSSCVMRRCEENGSVPQNSSDFLKEEECVCDGYDCSMQFPKSNPSYSLKGKTVKFRNNFICAVLQPPGGRHWYEFVKDENGKVIVKKTRGSSYTSQFIPCNEIYPIDKRYGGTTYYASTYGIYGIAFDSGRKRADYYTSNFMSFSRYFATDATPDEGNYDCSQHIIGPGSEIPFREYGVNLYPIFCSPLCTQLALVTDHDHNGACIPRVAKIRTIGGKLKNIYKKQYKEIVVDSWRGPGKTVAKQLKKLKESPSKFKLLNIVAHGTQFGDTWPDRVGMSLSVFTDTRHLSREEKQKKIITYELLEYLMQNRRQDEYYYILSNSCHGGGLVEKPFTHTDVNSPDYTGVSPNGNLGTNYVFNYSDCANSPSWSTNNDFAIDHMYINTYEANSTYTSTAISEARTNTIGCLVTLLQKQWSFIRDELLNLSKFQFTQETYNESISNASNLLIQASSVSGEDYCKITNELRPLIKKYPIVWLLYRVFGVLEMDDFWVWWNSVQNYTEKGIEPWGKKDFAKNHDGYMAAAMLFSRYNLRGLSNTAKAYLPTHELQIEPERRVSNYIDRMMDYINSPYLDDATKFERLQTYSKFVDFFHDCYIALHTMAMSVNMFHPDGAYFIQKWFLDDIPSVICQGSTEFKNCVFGKYPEFNEANLISEDEMKSMVYNYEEQ